MPARIGFEVNLGASGDTRASARRHDGTMRVLVLGDFSGRRNRRVETATDLATRPIMTLDLDSFAAVFKRMSPGLTLDILGEHAQAVGIGFATLDDFHPDHLYRTLEPFRALRESRARLLDAATFEQEAARVLASSAPAASDVEGGFSPSPPAAENAADLLQRLIGAPTAPASRASPPPGFIDGLIRKLVQPHIQQATSRAPGPYVAALDASVASLMRALLSHPDLQSLEAAWRGVRQFVESLAADDRLELCLVDVSKGELLADLAASHGDSGKSALQRLLMDTGLRSADGPAWSLLIGHYRFGATADDIALLAHLGVIASRAGAPLLAEAVPELVGINALRAWSEIRAGSIEDPVVEPRWRELRRSPAARWLGLALPRVLLRLPYGARTDAVESFEFEEFTAAADHDSYLWGNPALACAQVIARSWLEADDDASIDGPHEIQDLPAHVREHNGEKRLQPCAEVVLPLSTGEELLRRGLIPLLSYGNSNAVRVLGLQSISEPTAALPGLRR